MSFIDDYLKVFKSIPLKIWFTVLVIGLITYGVVNVIITFITEHYHTPNLNWNFFIKIAVWKALINFAVFVSGTISKNPTVVREIGNVVDTTFVIYLGFYLLNGLFTMKRK